MPEPSMKPWDMQPGETPKAFAHFLGYLGLGSERTLKEGARRADHSLAQYKRWSARWGWVRRAGQYDDHQAQQDELSRRVASEEVCSRLRQDGEYIRSVTLGLIRAMIRRDSETGALTVDAGSAARAVVPLFELHLQILDRLGLLPAVSGSRSRGARLHSPSAGQRSAVDERLERYINELPMDLATALTPEQQEQAELNRVTLRAFREAEDRILREKAQAKWKAEAKSKAAPEGGTEGAVAGDQPSGGGQTPGDANDGGEPHVDAEAAETE